MPIIYSAENFFRFNLPVPLGSESSSNWRKTGSRETAWAPPKATVAIVEKKVAITSSGLRVMSYAAIGSSYKASQTSTVHIVSWQVARACGGSGVQYCLCLVVCYG